MSQYKIDALRFKFQTKKKIWNTHPDMSLVQISNAKLRILDTRHGKDTLIIIPDGPNIIEHHFETIELLRQKFRIVVLDLPGFGFSTHDGSYDYSFSKTNTLLIELFDLLSIDLANLIFPCAGGFYSLAFARAFPEKVNQLFLVQTPDVTEMLKWKDRIIPGYLKKPYLSQMIMPLVEKKFAKTWYEYALPKGIDRQPYQNTALQGLHNGGNFCLCSLTQGISNLESSDLTIDTSIKTTLFYGNKDFTHNTTDFHSILQYNKKTDIIEFENCGHFPDLERKKLFAQIIIEKLA